MTTNTDHARHHREQHRQRPAETKPDRTASEPQEKTSTPDAVRVAKVARGDNGEKTTQHAGRRARGVDWVRPTDLMARHSAALAGRGIDFEVELARRTRRLSGQVAQAGGRGIKSVGTTLSERARRLPDVSEFGRGSRSRSWVTRSGIGLG
ncbi:hypothetical protein [Nesterenkonia ebinurensis]|uniref:hypothetical protein n=1 Tax=Nesterenkonia ebinurensis TaxID=2608252 RepID=UPI00168BED4D|nr:hypothetical protein [Nesterenkonia ebinurensis]